MRLVLPVLILILFSSSILSLNIEELENVVRTLINNPEYENDFNEHIEYLLKIEPDYYDYTPFKSRALTFDCDTSSSGSVPTSVHKLRPGDIKVVSALGDSLTASLGSNAKTIFGVLLEYRGRSWSIGGDDNLAKLVTMPNILKQFNPKLKGFSNGIDFTLTTKEGVGFNAAVSGQEANHIPQQARTLIDRIKSSKDIDFENDWKLVTLFIGGNDLCDFCKDKALHSPEAYITYVKDGLDLLHKELPRTFVNLVTVLNVGEVKLLNKGLVCSLLHRFECPCAAYPKSDEEEKELLSFLSQYQNYTENLINSGRYDTRDDFTVVVQPLMKDMQIPRLPDGSVDLSFFAPDCFHFSTKGQSSAAIGLWNNMLEPVGQKSTSWSPNPKILCPTNERPYLATNKN